MTTLDGAAAAAGMLPPRLSLAEEAGSPGDYEEEDDGGGAQAIAGSPIVAGAMNSRLKALTSSFARTIGDKLDYCIKDTETEWNAAFDFSKDTTFLTNCMKETKGACSAVRAVGGDYHHLFMNPSFSAKFDFSDFTSSQF
jgi:hypothetical protein